MNLRNVHRSPLSEQYERIMTIVDEINSWPDDERNFLLDRLDPKEEVKPAQKKSGKKPAKGTGKSARAASLAKQVGGTLASVAKTVGGSNENAVKILNAIDDTANTRCEFIRADGRACKLLPDHNIHHLPTANEYHPFVSAASPADGESLPPSMLTKLAANSETVPVAASNARHAGG